MHMNLTSQIVGKEKHQNSLTGEFIVFYWLYISRRCASHVIFTLANKFWFSKRSGNVVFWLREGLFGCPLICLEGYFYVNMLFWL